MYSRKMKLIILLFLLVFVAACSSCAWFEAQTKMNPKQQAIVWMGIYNSVYDDTLAVAKNPMSSIAQKEVAEKKRVILTQVWPLMKVYISVLEGGGTPTLTQTAAITDLINQLALLAGGV